MGVSAYSTVDEYFSGAVRMMSAPCRASRPGLAQVVHHRAGAHGGAYIRANRSRIWSRSASAAHAGTLDSTP